MNKSESIVKIAAALVRAQRKMGDATKGSKNPFFKSSYADLNAVREAVIPVFNEEGISVLQPTVFQEGKSFVETVLLHESGEVLTSLTEIVCAKQNDPQAHGSGVSYARRYGLQSFANVGSVDDDGEKAMAREPRGPAKTVAESKSVSATVVSPAVTKEVDSPKETAPVTTKVNSSFRRPKPETASATPSVNKTPAADEGWG